MTETSFTPESPLTATADVLALAARTTDAGVEIDAPWLDEAHRAELVATLALVGAHGAADEVVRLPAPAWAAARSLAVVGTGSGRLDQAGGPRIDRAEVLRRAAGAATRALRGVDVAVLALPAEGPAEVRAVAEGAVLGAYDFTRYRARSAKPDQAPVRTVHVAAPGVDAAQATAAVAEALVVARAVSLTRDLVNTAPADLYPASFAELVPSALEGTGVSVKVLDEQALAEGGYGGLLGVGKGSVRPPRLVVLEHAPEGASVHVALVGKGITFDSGGLSIKPAAGMEAMKSDMAGAASVLAAVAAVARLGLPVRVTGWLALAENMPSGSAQRPSDVLTVRGGRTVEVLNTDAEGRLVLADAIVAAGETGPDLIVDIATLTGAQMVALGNRVSAVMGNHDDLTGRIVACGGDAGEQFWPMPLPAELRKSMDSNVADIANMGERFGGMLVAGLFLKEFVPSRDGVEVPWAHLDIAGPSLNEGKAHGYTTVGGTGAAVATLIRLCADVARRPLA